MLLWGLSWSNAKILGQYFPLTMIMFWRFLFATLVLVPFIFIIKFDKNKLKNIFPKLFIASIIFCLYNFFYFRGTQLGLAGIGGVLVTTLMPVITTTFTIIFYKKRVSKNIKIGLFLGIISGFLLLKLWKYDFFQIIENGSIYFILGAFSWSILTLLIQNISRDISSIISSIILFFISSILILIFFPKSINLKLFNADLKFWIHFLFVSIGALAFGTVSFFYATQKLGAIIASSFSFLVPVSALFFSIILLKEIPDIISWIGCLFAIISVFIINYNPHNRFKE